MPFRVAALPNLKGAGENEIVCEPIVIVIFCVTGVAAAKLVLPACAACTVHVPCVSDSTLLPVTEHTAGVVLV